MYYRYAGRPNESVNHIPKLPPPGGDGGGEIGDDDGCPRVGYTVHPAKTTTATATVVFCAIV